MPVKKNVGIITYHSAYNFGSCLQAFATQQVINKIGFEAYIINYRLSPQREFYKIFHFPKGGIKGAVKDLLIFPSIKKYKEREFNFEYFINNLKLTEEIIEPEGVTQLSDSFDIYVSGSDQIWNKHSNELENADWKYMYPYLLAFTKKKKISFASSLVNMSKEELAHISCYISDFDKISCREQDSSERISKIIGKPVEIVLDPTLLLTEVDWRNHMSDLPDYLKGKKYILFYSLEGIKKVTTALKHLYKIAKSKNCELVAITPLSPILAPWVINAIDAGPTEYIRLIHDAAFIVTTSYHGTLFSVNFEKQFFSLKKFNVNDSRIFHILSKLGLQDRIYSSIDDIDFNVTPPDYDDIKQILSELREHSISYLRNNLCEEHS